MRQVCFDQSAQTADHHLVASAEDNSPVVAVGFNESRQTSSAKVSSQQTITHSFSPISQLFTRRRVRDFERNAAVGPDLSDGSPDDFLRTDVGRMIVAAVHHRNSRL